MTKFVVLGIDQGLASCGYGLIQFKKNKKGIIAFDKVLTYGLIKTTTKNSNPERLVIIHDTLENLIDIYKPSIISCERLFYTNPLEGHRNKSASIITTNMVTGIIHYLAGHKKLILKDFVPSSVKKTITGNGLAKKEDIISIVPTLMGLKPDEIKIEHIADALAIGYTAGMKIDEEDEEPKKESKKSSKKTKTKKGEESNE